MVLPSTQQPLRTALGLASLLFLLSACQLTGQVNQEETPSEPTTQEVQEAPGEESPLADDVTDPATPDEKDKIAQTDPGNPNAPNLPVSEDPASGEDGAQTSVEGQSPDNKPKEEHPAAQPTQPVHSRNPEGGTCRDSADCYDGNICHILGERDGTPWGICGPSCDVIHDGNEKFCCTNPDKTFQALNVAQLPSGNSYACCEKSDEYSYCRVGNTTSEVYGCDKDLWDWCQVTRTKDALMLLSANNKRPTQDNLHYTEADCQEKCPR